MPTERWKERLQMKRRGKDRFFRDDPRSPVSPKDRDGFQGLNYFPLDPDWRFEVPLNEYGEKEALILEASHAETREFVRWGELRFQVGGEEYTLQAYRSDPEDERLFVPFRDGTSGSETYEKGRYLDLEPELHRLDDGRWILDFNEAYNPWCAYSDDYVCPFASQENWLELPVRAGEKKFR